MSSIQFKPKSQKNFVNSGLDEVYDSYQDYLDKSEAEHRELVSKAQGIALSYTERMTPLIGDREAINSIREQIKSDKDFWQCSGMIVDLVHGRIDWISNIFRSEAKQAFRYQQEDIEKRRNELIAAKKAEKEREVQELQSLTHFGMF